MGSRCNTLDTVRTSVYTGLKLYISKSQMSAYFKSTTFHESKHTRWDYKSTILSFVNHSISRWFCSVLCHIGFLPTVQYVNCASSVLLATLFVLWPSDSHALSMEKLEAMTCACADHDLQTSMRICAGPVSARMERTFQQHASFHRDELQLVE